MVCTYGIPRMGAVPCGCCHLMSHPANFDLHSLQVAEKLENGILQDLFYWNQQLSSRSKTRELN